MSIDRNHIIDRYLYGAMSPSEEADFRKLLEIDDELRRLVEADNTLVRAMQSERVAMSAADHSTTYSRFLMSLASSVPTTKGVATEGSAGKEALLRRRMPPALLSSTRGIISIVAAAGALILAGIVAERIFLRHEGMRPPATAPGNAVPRNPESERTTPRRGEMERIDGRAPASAIDAPAENRESKQRVSEGETELRDVRNAEASPAKRDDASSPLPIEASPEKESRRELPVFDDDTLRTRLKMRE